jgi:hypothetical protein
MAASDYVPNIPNTEGRPQMVCKSSTIKCTAGRDDGCGLRLAESGVSTAWERSGVLRLRLAQRAEL